MKYCLCFALALIPLISFSQNGNGNNIQESSKSEAPYDVNANPESYFGKEIYVFLPSRAYYEEDYDKALATNKLAGKYFIIKGSYKTSENTMYEVTSFVLEEKNSEGKKPKKHKLKVIEGNKPMHRPFELHKWMLVDNLNYYKSNYVGREFYYTPNSSGYKRYVIDMATGMKLVYSVNSPNLLKCVDIVNVGLKDQAREVPLIVLEDSKGFKMGVSFREYDRQNLISVSIDNLIPKEKYDSQQLIAQNQYAPNKEEQKKKEKLLDLISEGNSAIRDAMETYTPIKGMTIQQVEYMNEIHENLDFRYDKMDRDKGNGFIYHTGSESGMNYANVKVVVYYFLDGTLIDVYRDLSEVRRVHGKFVIN